MPQDSETNIKRGGNNLQDDFEYYISAGTFRYQGNVAGLQQKLDALNSALNKEFNDVKIKVVGNFVKEKNTTCEILTLFFGILLIFPIFFMCCKWWRKIVYPAYEIPEGTYKKMNAVFNASTIRSIRLKVSDNGFNEKKTEILYNSLVKSPTKSFTFINEATPNDFREKQFTNFKQSMKKIKELPIKIDLQWHDQVIINEKK